MCFMSPSGEVGYRKGPPSLPCKRFRFSGESCLSSADQILRGRCGESMRCFGISGGFSQYFLCHRCKTFISYRILGNPWESTRDLRDYT